MRNSLFLLVFLAASISLFCGEKNTIIITSPAFQNNGMIPAKYTCDAKNISPELVWKAVPKGTKSLALITDDPDAPMGTWVHWVVFNIPADTTKLEEKIPAGDKLKNGALQGRNDFPDTGWGGPCPPSGTHRYFFKIYALDTLLSLKPGATKAELLKAMEGHITGQGEIIGKYKRKK